MYKTSRNLDLKTLIILHRTFVFLYLIYCCEIWRNTTVDPLIKLQKMCQNNYIFYLAPSNPIFKHSDIICLLLSFIISVIISFTHNLLTSSIKKIT